MTLHLTTLITWDSFYVKERMAPLIPGTRSSSLVPTTIFKGGQC